MRCNAMRWDWDALWCGGMRGDRNPLETHAKLTQSVPKVKNMTMCVFTKKHVHILVRFHTESNYL